MTKLLELLSQPYKSKEQKDLVKLVEDIEKAVNELDKGCPTCNKFKTAFEMDRKGQAVGFQSMEEFTEFMKFRNNNFCPNCGKDLRKEEL